MSSSIRTLVVGVADTSGDDPTLSTAVALAEAAGATLHVVHAFDPPSAMVASAGMPIVLPGTAGQIGAEVRQSLEVALRWRCGYARIECHAYAGPAGSVLPAVARDVQADLVVVGATRRGVLGRALLGTTAQHVVRASPAPVLVLRATSPGPLRRVLLTTDMFELSAAVHERALDVVARLSGPVRVERRSLLVVGESIGLPHPLRTTVLEVAERELGEFLRDHAGPVEPRVRQGEPGREILAEASEWGADLLVLGTHARRGLQRLVLGSVAEGCLRDAPCNVLVVPPSPAPSAAARESEAFSAGVS
jgi:nucleotide-binding universal stress UspA family protein